MNKKLIYALIPARGGSKSIPKKNILPIGGFPLIAYSIAAAKLTKKIARIIVSTDSQEIADLAKKYGAEVPFLRPTEISGDTSTDREFVIHALEWLQKNEGKIPDYFVHLRPTSPLRAPEKINEAIETMLKHPEATSLRSGHKINTVPQKCFALEGKFFVGLFPNDPRPDYHNLHRQSFPPTFKPDSYVDILKSSFVLKNPVIHGPKILAFLTPDIGDIDTQSDLKYVETLLKNQKFQVSDYLKANYPNENKINGNSKRILICGLGSIGKRHTENLLALGYQPSDIIIFRTGLGTKSFGDEFLSKNPNLKVYQDLDAALKEQPMAAIITNPTSLHVRTALKAAQAGCHVMIEKPLSDTMVGVKKLEKEIEKRKLVALVAFNHRFHPLLKEFKKNLENNELGQIISVEAHIGERVTDWHSWESYKVSYASRKNLGGGAITTQSHEIDFLFWLFGKPNWVFAAGGKVGDLETDAENCVSAIWRYNHFNVELHLDYFKQPAVRFLEATGEKGRLRWDYFDGKLKLIPLDGKVREFQQPANFNRNDMFLEETRHFLNLIASKNKPTNGIRENLPVMEIIVAMKRSLASGKKINL